MSNETPNNLFTLIKSLTKSEKRYFAIFSKRHILGSQNKYVLLFDALLLVCKELDSYLKSSYPLSLSLSLINVSSSFSTWKDG